MALLHQPQAWGAVSGTLTSEKVKVRVYDDFLFDNVIGGNGKDARALDYGPGPAVFASRLQQAGAVVDTFDTDPRMQQICTERLGADRVLQSIDDIRENTYDIVTCNLVLCINKKEEVHRICRTIRRAMRRDGDAYVGFCNPLLYNVAQTQLDVRQPTGNIYRKHHTIPKKKIEVPGEEYNLYDLHRPIYWYTQTFRKAGLEAVATRFTEEYEVGGNRVRDFVIFELKVP